MAMLNTARTLSLMAALAHGSEAFSVRGYSPQFSPAVQRPLIQVCHGRPQSSTAASIGMQESEPATAVARVGSIRAAQQSRVLQQRQQRQVSAQLMWCSCAVCSALCKRLCIRLLSEPSSCSSPLTLARSRFLPRTRAISRYLHGVSLTPSSSRSLPLALSVRDVSPTCRWD